MKKISLFFLFALVTFQCFSQIKVLTTTKLGAIKKHIPTRNTVDTLESPALSPGVAIYANHLAPPSGLGGYITGTNGIYNECYQKYSIQDYEALGSFTIDSSVSISEVLVWFGYKTTGPLPGNVYAKVYSVAYNANCNANANTTFDGGYAPGDSLGISEPVNMANIEGSLSEVLTSFKFSTPIPITQDSFFVSILFSPNPGDTLAIASSLITTTVPFPSSGWVSSLTYVPDDFNHLIGYDLDLAIFPIVTDTFIPPCDITLSQTHSSSQCGQSNGSINLTVTGNTSAVSYLWNNGATTQNLDSLVQGNYTVTVTDSACSQALTVSINNSNGPVISATHNDITCINLMGSITDSVTGGTPPYTFQWSNGATTQNIDSLQPGNYYLTVTDNSGCAGYTIIPVYYNVSDQLFVYAYGTPANCNNHNGTLIATTYGGIPPYAYVWSTGQSTSTATGLTTGNYSVIATDSLGCATTGFGTVTDQCVNIIEGKVFNDVNGNCTYGAGDTPIPYVYVTATDSNYNSYYGVTDSNGNYYIEVDANGTYNLTTGFYYYNSCGNVTPCGNPSANVTFNSMGDSSLNNNFGLTSSGGFDLTMHPGWTSANPGFAKQYWVMPYNQSFNPFSGTATITFYYDPHLIYDSSRAPLPTVIDTVNHILIWNTTYVPSPSFDWYNGRFISNFTVRANTPLSYQLQSEFLITPLSGDCDTSNNRFIYSDLVTGSHDPNEKDVSPVGNIPYEDSVLTYTIHFQNTGNDTTNFIILKDTLSPYLDASSVVNLASSNNYENFGVSGKGVLTWTFTPIYLVDSVTNAAKSKGFITFSVKKKKSTPGNTNITNRASVYFDYNAPVVTNTVNSYVNFPTATKNISVNNSFAVFPNPTGGDVTISAIGNETIKQITITNVLGQAVSDITISNGNDNTINVHLPDANGMYFIHLRSNKGEYVSKVVKN